MKVPLAIALSFIVSSEAMAQSGNTAKEAAAAFKAGVALLKQKDFTRACALLEESQRLDPQYGTEINLAICYAQLHRLYDAWRLYHDVAEHDQNAQRAASARQAAAELWSYLSRLHLRFDGSVVGLKVTIDARDVTPLVNTDIPLNEGRHVITASLPGASGFHQDVNLSSGEKLEVLLALTADPPTASRTQPPPSRPPTRRAWHWYAIGSGGALVAGGLAAGWRAMDLNPGGPTSCRVILCSDDARKQEQHQIDRARTWANVSTIAVALGGVAISGGVYLWITSRGQPLRIDAAAAPSSASLVVSGIF